jgi:hypothetical protein
VLDDKVFILGHIVYIQTHMPLSEPLALKLRYRFHTHTPHIRMGPGNVLPLHLSYLYRVFHLLPVTCPPCA